MAGSDTREGGGLVLYHHRANREARRREEARAAGQIDLEEWLGATA